jgi:hypothetical protein
MYSTCLSCHAPLGANDMIEHFAVGRKLAFDPAKGRLWAICLVCRQWNLAALDERWEAIEQAERKFRATRLRVSKENVGLAKLADGTELVRIGDPQRPEFAAWRYGERFTRRWRAQAPIAAVGTVGALMIKFPVLSLFQFAPALLVPLGIPVAAAVGIGALRGINRGRKERARIQLPDGKQALLTQAHLEALTIERDVDQPGGWRLRIKHSRPEWTSHSFEEMDPVSTVAGDEAIRLAAQLLPRINRTGGRRSAVAEAVEVLERAGDVDGVFRLAGTPRATPGRWRQIEERWFEDPSQAGYLANATAPIRLAVEMAAHEEQERRLMEGELKALEEQWKQAEEIAAIADALTLPPAVLRQLEKLRIR